jgi:hypothetical protein
MIASHEDNEGNNKHSNSPFEPYYAAPTHKVLFFKWVFTQLVLFEPIETWYIIANGILADI